MTKIFRLKTCPKCGKVKPATADYWQRNKSKPDGLSSMCKSCRQAYDKTRDAIRNRTQSRKLLLRVAGQNSRAATAGVIGRLTPQDIRTQYDRQNGRCYWCNGDLNGHYHIDHVKPFQLGGDNTPDNIVCACHRCNVRKSNKKVYTWLGVLASRGISHPDKPETMPVQLSLFD